MLTILGCRGLRPITYDLTPQPEPELGSISTSTPFPTSATSLKITPEVSPTFAYLFEIETQIKSTVIAGLPSLAFQEEVSDAGITNVSILPLVTQKRDISYWVVYSNGLRVYDPPQSHFVTMFGLKESSLYEIDRYELECPDILAEGGVSQVDFGDEDIWLMVDGYVGAHGGCIILLKFDGEHLIPILSHASDTPPAGEVKDLDQDGIPEVLLNNNMSYVFCYACGVVLADYLLYRWENGEMAQVQPILINDDVPEEVRLLNNQSVLLAKAELWKDAQGLINQVVMQYPDNPFVKWNAIYINLIADARASWVKEGTYPLLSWLFYGDYQAILDEMRGYPVATLFGRPNPLITDTAAEGFETEVVRWIEDFTTRTIAIHPDLAAPYFLRGWATYLENSQSEAALTDINHAVQLSPEERLYSESLACLMTNCPSIVP